jgi:rod shape-determining protein MreC
LFGLLAVVLLMLDNRYAPIHQAKSHIATVLYPLQWLANKPWAAVQNGLGYLKNQHTLNSQNQQLQADNARLQVQLHQQTAQIQALGGLAAVEKLQQAALPQALVAQIMSTGKNPLSDKVIIDQGSRQGVRLGDPVTDAHGLVGQISSVQPFSAEVTLLTNSQTVVPAMVSRTGVRTLVYGRAGGVDLRYFPADASLQAQDLLVTSGLDSIYPAGIPIATVQEAQAGNGSPYYRVQLSPAAQSGSARFLLVVPQQNTVTAQAASDSPSAAP